MYAHEGRLPKCVECGWPMRPRRTMIEQYPRTRATGARGLCAGCYSEAHAAGEHKDYEGTYRMRQQDVEEVEALVERGVRSLSRVCDAVNRSPSNLRHMLSERGRADLWALLRYGDPTPRAPGRPRTVVQHKPSEPRPHIGTGGRMRTA